VFSVANSDYTGRVTDQDEASVISQPRFSLRLARPFLKVLRNYPNVPASMIDPMEAMDPDDRIPAELMQKMLQGVVELTGDPHIGLKAARAVDPGEFGVIEYLARSAPNVRGAIDVAGRYLQLVNDAMRFELTVDGPTATLELQSSIPEPAVAEAFGVAAFYLTITRTNDAEPPPESAVCFKHPRPEDVREYESVFKGMRLVFDAGFTGFRFPAVALDLPMPTGDAALLAVLKKHAEQVLAELPRVETFVDRVRRLILEELNGGNPSAIHIADCMAVSPRTLTRKLEQHGTSFKQELDTLRQGLATRYAVQTDMQLSEIALLLGFSNAASFHRAFKRWTSQTPLDYRRMRRRV
jgi:AraC-like DNA-binding protein